MCVFPGPATGGAVAMTYKQLLPLHEKKARRGTMGLIMEFLDRDAYKAKVYEVMLRHFNNLRKTK